ncbi:strictosidine synthase [Raphidocelis subcapitata]|uniref:Strictosidine synthase n=1 Tax=Raphidocelis subcapitata TaxID=307507 RepID=A0A2V0NXB4_9CHLO|nr:strictosidine synthase [Raphidocelis subcapitata]|eukprot:GBF92278.1 strictosidine synthase [Raphidocelis subcapitata]
MAGSNGPPRPKAARPSSSGSLPRSAIILGIVAGLASIRTGWVAVPLPYPANGKHVHVAPGDVLPWRPRPFEGEFAHNTKLQRATRLFEGKIQGSESVAVSPEGRLVMLDKFNRVWEAEPAAGGGYELGAAPVAHLGAGRPLGYHFDANGDLIVCDSYKGLLKLERATGRVELLTDRVSDSSPLDPGSFITYANDLDIAADGRVYFTSCSNIVPQKGEGGYWDTYRGWLLDVAQASPEGRLLRYDPATRETVVLTKGFYYGNGVALSKDGSFLLMVETNRIRVHRYWIKGPKAGTSEVVIDRLPGVPDGVSRAADGSFWLAMLSPVPPIAKLLGEPGVRAVFAWMPDWLRPPPRPAGMVAKITGDGEVLDFLDDPTGERVAYISAVSEAGGRLFIGNLVKDYVSVLDLGGGGGGGEAGASH